VYEDTYTQRGYHGIWDQQEARNIEKCHTPGQANVYQLKTNEERREPYKEAKRDKEKKSR
jgi:hypothetical protein